MPSPGDDSEKKKQAAATTQARRSEESDPWSFLRELLVYAALVRPTLIYAVSYLVGVLTRRSVRFKSDSDIPDLTGRVVVVTGANGGIGKETVLRLALHGPAKIYLAARSEGKAKEAIEDVKKTVPEAEIVFVPLDLTSFESVKRAAGVINGSCSRLDILVLNAGIMATPWDTTKEGFEAQFGTNHVGHALFTHLLLPKMNETAKLPNADVRIVSVSSLGHHMAPKGGIILDQAALKTFTPAQLYGQSKLANILFAKALAKRYPKILSVAVHPGFIKTELYSPVKKARWIANFALNTFGGLVFSDVKFGALNQLWAATAPRKDVVNGAYYMPVGKGITASKYARDEGLADKLWEWTEEQFGKHGISKGTEKTRVT